MVRVHPMDDGSGFCTAPRQAQGMLPAALLHPQLHSLFPTCMMYGSQMEPKKNQDCLYTRAERGILSDLRGSHLGDRDIWDIWDIIKSYYVLTDNTQNEWSI